MLEETKPPEDDVDEREEESDEEEPPMKKEDSSDPYAMDLGATMKGKKPDFGISSDRYKEFNDLDDEDEDDQKPDFN